VLRRGRGTIRLSIAAVVLIAAGGPRDRAARADRAAGFFVGPELRMRTGARDGRPGNEVALPHGLISEDGKTAYVGRLGFLWPLPEGALVVPISVGARLAPLHSVVRPVLGVDLGGYLVRMNGARSEDSPAGPQLCWSMRALAGAQVALGRHVAVVGYVDASWVQSPRDTRARSFIGSALGTGIELRVSFTPHFGLTDMLLQGTNAPKGL
jgi:hypothetical protein